jgi:hypothetical protein
MKNKYGSAWLPVSTALSSGGCKTKQPNMTNDPLECAKDMKNMLEGKRYKNDFYSNNSLYNDLERKF